MTLELGGRKVVVTGEERELARTSAESVSHEGADLVIWIREWKGDVNELNSCWQESRRRLRHSPMEHHHMLHSGARPCGPTNLTGSVRPALTVAQLTAKDFWNVLSAKGAGSCKPGETFRGKVAHPNER